MSFFIKLVPSGIFMFDSLFGDGGDDFVYFLVVYVVGLRCRSGFSHVGFLKSGQLRGSPSKQSISIAIYSYIYIYIALW